MRCKKGGRSGHISSSILSIKMGFSYWNYFLANSFWFILFMQVFLGVWALTRGFTAHVIVKCRNDKKFKMRASVLIVTAGLAFYMQEYTEKMFLKQNF